MREEIAAAVVFLSRLVRQNDEISKEKVDKFSNRLSAILVEKFKNHWYKDKPTKGQGYRCIRINPFEPIDPILEKAATDSGLQIEELQLPVELTLWVDPSDVSCRLGESHGSFCTLAECRDGNLQNRAHTVNIKELLEKERERHNQQINIVTTRSRGRSSAHFNRGLIYGGNANFYSKHQHNFYRNKNGVRQNVNKNEIMAKKATQEESNTDRESPEHINEIRQQFLNQVNSVIAGNNDASSGSPVMPKSVSPQEIKPQTVVPTVAEEPNKQTNEKQQEQVMSQISGSPKQSHSNKGGKNSYRNQQNKGKQNLNQNPGHYPHHQKSLQENGATNHWNKVSSTSNQGKCQRSQ